MLTITAGWVVHPGGLLHVLDAVDDGGDVRQPHRRAVAVRDDQRAVFARSTAADRWRRSCTPARGPSKLPLAWLTLAAATAVRTSSSVEPVGGERAGFAWMRTAGFCPPLMLTRPTPDSCEIFGASRVSARSSTFDSGSVVDVERQREDRRVRRIDLAVDRRLRQVGGQERARRIDRCLHFLLGDVDVQIRGRTAA